MSTTKPTHLKGRQDLESWARSQPENFFEADDHLQAILPLYVEPSREAALMADMVRFGREASTIVDGLVRQNNKHENLPRLDRYTPYGTRQERIDHHPTYHEVGRYIYGSGVMSAFADGPNMVGALTRFYVSSFNGEAGHNCPLACTAGVIRVLQELGSPELKQRFLPGLLDRRYEHHLEGAQFLTEIQGGSDVGQNATVATQQEDGSWQLEGEKWFCSNIDADVFLMTARIVDDSGDGAKGTRGLGLFFVPRLLEDGQVNAFHIRRLKDKIGTRSMASGECDFRGATAYHMGDVGDGFKHMMRLVINVSRLYNAMACGGAARRALMDAHRYATHRRAFGAPIAQYPLIQETLADMRAKVDAMTSGGLYLAHVQDKLDRGQLDEVGQGFLRMAVNINKLVSAKRTREVITDAIEVLGGNGAIETFSVLPRLLRDAIVMENWEGTHNTLLTQCLRDMQKYKVHQAFMAHVATLIEETDPALGLAEVHQALSGQIEEVLDAPFAQASLQFRPLAEALCGLFYAAVRGWEAKQVALSALSSASLAHDVEVHIHQRRPHHDPVYLDRLAVLAGVEP